MLFIEKLFLISLTKGNCSDKNHKSNKEYANANNVYQFNLFDGWYDSLFNNVSILFIRYTPNKSINICL